MHTIGNTLLWSSFLIVLIVMLTIDLLIYDKNKSPSIKQAGIVSLLWFILAIIFNILFWVYLLQTESKEIANSCALAFLTGYLIEKNLSIDNVAVWLMLFNYFSIPLSLQRYLLTWGVLGAVILRTIMVFTESWLINEFQWLFYIFGIFLFFTGIKIALSNNTNHSIGNHQLLHCLYYHLRVTNKLHGDHFFIRHDGMLFVTPLLLTLIMVEFSDIIFSIDSIPAIFSITTDPFIVLTSNLFAVVGLRAMYFLLANIAERFSLIKYGIAVILIFISIKIFLMKIIHIPVIISLTVIMMILIITLLINIWWVNHK